MQGTLTSVEPLDRRVTLRVAEGDNMEQGVGMGATQDSNNGVTGRRTGVGLVKQVKAQLLVLLGDAAHGVVCVKCRDDQT